MPLSANAQALLDACAKAIAANMQSDINLFPLNRERRSHDEIPGYLAQQVELLTGRKRTIRAADVALFAHHVMGPNSYLVVCAADTPEGKVTELTDDMVLVSLGPYSNGFNVDAERATPEAVAKYRAFVNKSNIEHDERKAAEEAATVFLRDLTSTARSWVWIRDDLGETLQQELLELLEPRWSSDKPTLEKVALVCAKMGMTIQQLTTKMQPED